MKVSVALKSERCQDTRLMEKGSKGWKEDGFVWYECKDCGHKWGIEKVIDKIKVKEMTK